MSPSGARINFGAWINFPLGVFIEGNGLRAGDKGNEDFWKELSKNRWWRWVEGRFNPARGDDTEGEKVVFAGREKGGQDS